MHTRQQKIAINLITLTCFIGLSPILIGCASSSKPSQQNAQKVFEEKCRTLAGTKIYKNVENVDGILLLKIRPKFDKSESITKDRFLPHAAFISEFGGDYYIKTFLRNEVSTNSLPVSPSNRGNIVPLIKPKDRREKNGHPGYKFVDYIDPVESRHYRYTESIEITGKMDTNEPSVKMGLELYPNLDLNIYTPVLKRVEIKSPAPRYAVTYEDHIIPEDRALGIASSTIKVIDTASNELLAEYTNYARGVGFDSKFSDASWLSAYSCLSGYKDSHARTREFVDQVLIPAK